MTMPIPLIHEDYTDMSFQEAFSVDHLVEKCFFCKEPTRFWHQASNEPVCPACSQTHQVGELPRLRGKEKEARIKSLSQAAIKLHAENDALRAEEALLEKQRLALTRKKISLHRQMTDAKLVIKNPMTKR
jgi:hypothetical protein